MLVVPLPYAAPRFSPRKNPPTMTLSFYPPHTPVRGMSVRRRTPSHAVPPRRRTPRLVLHAGGLRQSSVLLRAGHAPWRLRAAMAGICAFRIHQLII